MKTLLLFTLLLLSSLQATSLTLSEFRQMHRSVLLSEFKSLYKQRHLGAHKAALRAKYRRIKKVSHTTLHQHISQMSSKEGGENMGMSSELYTTMEHTSNANMQMQANNNYEAMKEHTMPKVDVDKPFSQEQHQNSGNGENTLNPSMSENEPPNSIQPETETGQEPIMQEESMPTTNEPVNGGGDEQKPIVTMPDEEQSTTPSEPMQEDDTMDSVTSGDSFNNEGKTPKVRSLYANPWRRR